MKRPTPPQILTASDPIGAFESAIPLLIEILPDKCSSSDLVREIVWSIYHNHPVSLFKVCILDQDRKDAVLALINLRMALGGDSHEYVHQLLKDSGELDRYAEAKAQAEKLGVRYTFYPLTRRLEPRNYDEMADSARALDKAESR